MIDKVHAEYHSDERTIGCLLYLEMAWYNGVKLYADMLLFSAHLC